MLKKTIILTGIISMLLVIPLTYSLLTNNGDGTITFSYTTTTANAQRIQNAFTEIYQYQTETCTPEGECTPNTETQSQFTERKIKEYIKQVTKQYEKEMQLKALELQIESEYTLDVN